MSDKSGLIAKGRLEALTDGVFAFAMTLLVLNLELPENFHPTGPDDVLNALRRLGEPLLAYAITFYVLARRWLGQAAVKEGPEGATESYSWAVIHHLFFITLMPFSTMVVGEYASYAPAVWLYSANVIAAALAAIWIARLGDRERGYVSDPAGNVSLTVLVVSALLAIAISLVEPRNAMWAYLLNFAAPWVDRWVHPAKPA